MTELVLAKTTKLAVNNFINRPGHALLIVGPISSGKHSLAADIASEIVGLDSTKLLNYSYFYDVAPKENTISIEQIRQLKDFLKLKTAGSKTIRRVVIIDQSDHMTDEAQNSLLKTLEEPPDDTLIILTALNLDSLRSTVVSRCQVLVIHKPDLSSAMSYFESTGYSTPEVESKFILANGSIGLMKSMLDKSDTSNLLAYVDDAKQVLKESQFERLLRVDELSKNRELLAEWLYALRQVCLAAMKQSIKKNQTKLAKHWLNCTKAVMESEDRLKAGANLKLMLTSLFDDLEYN